MTHRSWSEIKREKGVPDAYRSPLLGGALGTSALLSCGACGLRVRVPYLETEPVMLSVIHGPVHTVEIRVERPCPTCGRTTWIVE